MASSKRRSEIHALSIEDSHLRFDSSDGSVTLLCQPGFLAKNELPSMASKPFKVFLELVEMKMKIDSSALSGLRSSILVELSLFEVLARDSSFP
ncbi:hypothetical protein DPMN_117687 [Dreissena polymorpha]|uniref:Uncharacterized protein n=1 Tax=Dreissena polymorpha TaxID=45954 RepID=A0A9D4GIT8_DREPO|nr:hypothetical protein DPMN_117687 [Dreissena polymorpha]